MKDEFENPHDFEEFLKAVSDAVAYAEIYREGVRYVDDVEFWRFLTNEVVKAPMVDGARLPLTNADGIQRWVNQRVAEDKGHYVQHVLQNRGAEFDFVREKQDSWFEALKGKLWRRATPLEDYHGIDAVSHSPFSGVSETHQIKAGTSDAFRKVDLGKYVDGKSQVDQIHVNEKIHKWRTSPQGRASIAERGDDHPFVQKSFSDEQLVESGERRMANAKSGSAAPQLTPGTAFNQIGRGAVVGTVVSITATTLMNYRRYQTGEIDGETFGDLILMDGAYGGVMGGSIAAANIPVQIAAHAIGVGAPITIPVMMLFSATLRKVIDPIFKRGEYAEVLSRMEIDTNIGVSAARFAQQCSASFESHRAFIKGVDVLHERAAMLDTISNHTDEILEAVVHRTEGKTNECGLETNQQRRRRKTNRGGGGDI